MVGSVLVAVLLSAHGGEGTREEKFRGALFAEAGAPAQLDRVATQRELDTLIAERPTLFPSGIAMSIGGAFTLVGLITLTIMAAVGPSSFAGIIFLIVAAVGIPGGLLVSLVAGLVMISVAVDQGVFDQRIRLLKGKLEQPSEPPPALPSVFAPSPFLLLARF